MPVWAAPSCPRGRPTIRCSCPRRCRRAGPPRWAPRGLPTCRHARSAPSRPGGAAYSWSIASQPPESCCVRTHCVPCVAENNSCAWTIGLIRSSAASASGSLDTTTGQLGAGQVLLEPIGHEDVGIPLDERLARERRPSPAVEAVEQGLEGLERRPAACRTRAHRRRARRGSTGSSSETHVQALGHRAGTARPPGSRAARRTRRRASGPSAGGRGRDRAARRPRPGRWVVLVERFADDRGEFVLGDDLRFIGCTSSRPRTAM